ncbi:MAG: isoprenylcysteine carboxylmethyltransferase family protein [Gemmatimonadetes bacterium]|nr:isoprenylcysteine carboxylmethyltransferase family protein [Gemmatimonadota bacterium]NNM07360.1 isoprenylcysteine carboxylmethyltransferase family protein [Gemmatimonadota bacterium]
MLMIRGIIRVLIQVLVFGAFLFLPIGTWQWPRALQFLAVMGVLSLISTVAMAWLVPASLEARVKRGAAKNQPRADRLVSLVLAILHIAWFILLPNDVFRWQLLPKPGMAMATVGAVLALMGYGIMLTSVWQNAYATPIVGDQSERKQVLIDTGIYSWVRHPMYLGHLFFLTGLSLWLESYTGLLLVPLVFSPLIARILVEEKTLLKTLPGYDGYGTRVPFRLIPFVW